MKVHRAGILALLLGCGADAGPNADAGSSAEGGVIGTCVAENPSSEPFDVGDTEGASMPAPVPGGPPIIEPPPTAGDIAQYCRDGGGSGCDEQAFISRAAADCIAQETGLAAGIRPWNTSLNYFENHQRVAWGIMTVRENTPSGYWGELLVLDATSGEELDRGSYTAQF